MTKTAIKFILFWSFSVRWRLLLRKRGVSSRIHSHLTFVLASKGQNFRTRIYDCKSFCFPPRSNPKLFSNVREVSRRHQGWSNAATTHKRTKETARDISAKLYHQISKTERPTFTWLFNLFWGRFVYLGINGEQSRTRDFLSKFIYIIYKFVHRRTGWIARIDYISAIWMRVSLSCKI